MKKINDKKRFATGVRVVWGNAPENVNVEIHNNGRFIPAGKNLENGISFPGNTAGELALNVINASVEPGAHATVIGVRARKRSFSFFLRDALDRQNPIFIPEYSVAVTAKGDRRNYNQIAGAIAARRLVGDLKRFEQQPEESWESAAGRNCTQPCQTWLGLSRDCRIFFINPTRSGFWGTVNIHKNGDKIPPAVSFCLGHGSACSVNITRSLEDQCLPILRSVQKEDRIDYRLCAFASLLNGPLDKTPVVGSDYRCCAPSGLGTPTDSFATDREKLAFIRKETVEREDKVICIIRVEAVNSSEIPSYAWFKTPVISAEYRAKPGPDFSGGFSLDVHGNVFTANLLDGRPMPQAEAAVLIPPGGRVMFDMIIPHSPLPVKQARALMALNIPDHLKGARKFWRKKLDSAGKITVPEHPLNDIIKANLLNLELVTLGREPNAPLAARAGLYPPIGTESSPIIQYWDSAGKSEPAERAIDFFLARQWPDGFIQTYGNYMSETGALLWTMGEHFRYTCNLKWLKRVTPNIVKACEQQLNWRNKNKTGECRKKGYYGMIAGRVADDDCPFHWFFLNAGCYIGLKRSAEMLRHTAPDFARTLAGELETFRKDIRAAFFEAAAKAIVVPSGDGSWAPWISPWVEYRGATSLYADGGNAYSHEAFLGNDSLLGPLWLIFQEVVDPGEPVVDLMLKANQYPATTDNAALTQPYYSRHDYVHLRRGQVKAFLKTYYNQLTGLVDRETFTFWEHYCHNSPNKTHEAAWFLMQTRWMLYIEEGDCMNMLSMAPRRWFEHGKEISIENMSCYFGKISLRVSSRLETGHIACEMIFHDPERKPPKLKIRIPHPDGKKAIGSSAGVYDPSSETVIFDPCRESITWKVMF